MKAITTKYFGVTATKPARYVATDSDRNRAQSSESHDDAARALCAKMKWTGLLIRGHIASGNVYVWTEELFPDDEIEATTNELDRGYLHVDNREGPVCTCPKCGKQHHTLAYVDHGTGDESGRIFRYCSQHCKDTH